MTINKENELIIRKFIHELRNPLTALYSAVQLLEVKNPELKEIPYWPSVRYNIEDMIELIQAFSDLSRAEYKSPEEFDFNILLRRISLSFAASIADSKVEYTSKINISNSKITGDKTKIQEVFTNLLKNAYEASAPNGSINLHAFEENDKKIVEIRDNGCGMDESQIQTIFEPFVTYKENGTGLGLAICKQIVLAHGGTISVSSELGIGTTFRVELPA